jgi:hypothetical protein
VSVTDADQLTEIQATLQEDSTFSNGLWSLAEVLGYFNYRQYRFLVETKIIAAQVTIGWTPGVAQQPLPVDWIATIGAVWHDFASGEYTTLPHSDYFGMDHVLGPLGANTVGYPQAYRETDTTETLTGAVSPAPAAPGELSLLYVSLSEILDGQGQIFDVPDDWVPYLKYGVYADMLGKSGRGQDLLRARYAEQRYQEGIVLAQSLLQGWA